MATTTLTLACTASAMISYRYVTENWHTSPVLLRYIIEYSDKKKDPRSLLLSFQEFPDSLKYNLIKYVYLTLHYRLDDINMSALSLYGLTGSFVETTVTAQTKPDSGEFVGSVRLPSDDEVGQNYSIELPSATQQSTDAARALVRSPNIAVWANNDYNIDGPKDVIHAYLRDAEASLRPTLVVAYDDAKKRTFSIGVTNGPTSGYINPRVSNSWRWSYQVISGEFSVAERNVQTEAIFYWSPHGQASWSAIYVSGDVRTLNVPAGTFPIGTSIDFYLWARRDDGTTTTTPTYTLSTAAATMYATPVSPASSIEANDGPITFRWNASSSDGQAQDGATLQYSTDGSSWSALGTVTGTENAYTAPANTFPSGTIYWRVRSNNIDGTTGPWSDPTSFVSFGAPTAPSVTVTPGGFAVIRWQASEQEAYRVTVDGKIYGPFFGKDKSFQVKDPLDVGEHTASVEVQNSFGLWSKPGTATFTVPNTGHAKPKIPKSRFDVDATLEITVPNANSSNALYVYRDGVKIASLPLGKENITFTDRFALGVHSYKVVQHLVNYYAAISETVTGKLKSCTTRIALLSGGPWIELKLSENSQREEAFAMQKTVSLRHVSGAAYPVAEIGPYLDGSGSYDVAFTDVESAAAFEALFGQPVIVKSRGGNVVVGVLSNLDKRTNELYINYTFTIQRIYWRDYVDLTNS